MELIEKKEIDPMKFHLRKMPRSENYVIEKDGKVIAIVFENAFDDFVSLLSMAGASFNFMNKKGGFATEDDLKSVL